MELVRMSAAGNVFYLALCPAPPVGEREELAHAICAGRALRSADGLPGAPADGLIFG